jgi:hypothetical protein
MDLIFTAGTLAQSGDGDPARYAGTEMLSALPGSPVVADRGALPRGVIGRLIHGRRSRRPAEGAVRGSLSSWQRKTISGGVGSASPNAR